ncbi:hypothetical protein ACMFMG_005951 [Clarireedia jacksonii]
MANEGEPSSWRPYKQPPPPAGSTYKYSYDNNNQDQTAWEEEIMEPLPGKGKEPAKQDEGTINPDQTEREQIRNYIKAKTIEYREINAYNRTEPAPISEMLDMGYQVLLCPSTLQVSHLHAKIRLRRGLGQ